MPTKNQSDENPNSCTYCWMDCSKEWRFGYNGVRMCVSCFESETSAPSTLTTPSCMTITTSTTTLPSISATSLSSSASPSALTNDVMNYALVTPSSTPIKGIALTTTTNNKNSSTSFSSLVTPAEHHHSAFIDDYSHNWYMTRSSQLVTGSGGGGVTLDSSSAISSTSSSTTLTNYSSSRLLQSYAPSDDQLYSLFFDTSYYDVQGRRKDWATHAGHDYQGTWLPHIARWSMQRYTKKGDRILSNFLGRGTDAIEALLLERKIIGVDINPVQFTISGWKDYPKLLIFFIPFFPTSTPV